MAQRYFFRPIAGRTGNITSALGTGIQQGVANYERQRQTRRAEAMQDEDRQIQDEDREIALAERGWRAGPSPKVERTVDSSDVMPDLPGDMMGQMMGRAATGPFNGMKYMQDDPRFQQVGGYHRLTEEAMRNRDRARLGGPATALMSAWGAGGSPEPFIDLIEAGIDPEQGLPWRERPGYQAMLEQRGYDEGVREEAASDAERLARIREGGATRRTEISQGSQDARQTQAIRADAFRSMLDQYISQDDEGNYVYNFPAPVSDMWEAWMSGQEVPGSGETTVPAGDIGLAEDEIGQIRELIQRQWANASEQEVERYLMQAGYTEQQVAAILGGR